MPSASVCTSAQTLGKGEGRPKTARRGVEKAIFSWREIAGAFEQPVFLLAMTIIAFEKEVSLPLKSGNVCKSCPLHFGSEKSFPSNFTQETILGHK